MAKGSGQLCRKYDAALWNYPASVNVFESFFNLETKHFVNKTVPKVVKENGQTITSQEGILAECKNFYNDL